MPSPADESPSLTFYRRTFALALVAALGALLYRVLEPFFGPLGWGIVLAFLMHPAQERLARLLRGRAGAAAAILTGLTFIIFIGPLTLVGSAFASQEGALITVLEHLVTQLRTGHLNEIFAQPAMSAAIGWGERTLNISADDLRSWLAAGADTLLQPLVALGRQAFFGAIGTVVNFTIMLFLLFFLLRDGVAILRAALGLVPMPAARRHELMRHIGNVTRAVVFGTLVTSALQGVSVAVAFAIVSLPSPIVFGGLAGVLSVVPIGGTALVWGPAALWLLAAGRPGAGLFLLAWGVIVVGVADNLIRPLLISGRTEVPTLAIFIGVLGGLAAFGLVGMVLGPLLISLAIVLVRAGDEALASR